MGFLARRMEDFMKDELMGAFVIADGGQDVYTLSACYSN